MGKVWPNFCDSFTFGFKTYSSASLSAASTRTNTNTQAMDAAAAAAAAAVLGAGSGSNMATGQQMFDNSMQGGFTQFDRNDQAFRNTAGGGMNSGQTGAVDINALLAGFARTDGMASSQNPPMDGSSMNAGAGNLGFSNTQFGFDTTGAGGSNFNNDKSRFDSISISGSKKGIDASLTGPKGGTGDLKGSSTNIKGAIGRGGSTTTFDATRRQGSLTIERSSQGGIVDPGFGVDPPMVDPGFGVDPPMVDPGFGVDPPMVDPGFGVDPNTIDPGFSFNPPSLGGGSLDPNRLNNLLVDWQQSVDISQAGVDSPASPINSMILHPSQEKSYDFNPRPYMEPCTPENIKGGRLYFKSRNDPHRYIQCDANGQMHLRICSTRGKDWFDIYSMTCVDGPVHVDNRLSPRSGK